MVIVMIKCICCGKTPEQIEDDVAIIAISPLGGKNRKWACTKCLGTYPDLAHKVNKSKFTLIKE